jgi:hypothetical protein
MIKGKQGSIFLGLLFALIIWIFGILVLSFFLDDITQSRVDLNCSNPTAITSGTMVTCLVENLVTPLWIITFSSLALGLILGRNL